MRSVDRSRLKRLRVSLRRPLRLAAAGFAGYLVWLHALLLWERIVDQRFFEPDIALRWAASIALVALLAARLRAGAPLLRGRNAAVIWLLVALLHVGLPASGTLDSPGEQAGRLLFVLPVAAGLVATLDPMVRAAVGTRRFAGDPIPLGALPAPRAGSALATGWSRALFGRPPPR